MNRILLTIYADVSGYPPTLNAIYLLAKIFDEVVLIERNFGEIPWIFPSNVKVISSGNPVTLSNAKDISFTEKIKGYWDYRINLQTQIKISKPSVVLAYDTVALGMLQTITLPKSLKLWYHNHDVVHHSEMPKLSLLRIFKYLEEKMIKERVDLFTLPTQSRLSYFPNIREYSKTMILPNYPSSNIYASAFEQKHFNAEKDELRLIHQGVFLPNNFENLVKSLLESKLRTHLVLAGPEKEDVAQFTGFDKNRFTALGRLAYRELPEITKSCHIGLALYGEHNIMVRTVSTASNKIFEYISLGLPVIFIEREDFRTLFGHYKWANFVYSDYSNLQQVLQNIMTNYSRQSKSARETFLNECTFEAAFSNVQNILGL